MGSSVRTALFTVHCSSCVRTMSLYWLFLLCLTTASMASTANSRQDDPCVQKETNCWQEGNGHEIGHTTYLPDIEVCEGACRETLGCTWFTYHYGNHFNTCYLLRDCPNPRKEDLFSSGQLTQCSP